MSLGQHVNPCTSGDPGDPLKDIQPSRLACARDTQTPGAGMRSTMKRHAPAARWVLSAGAVLGLLQGCTTDQYTPDEEATALTPQERQEIEARDNAQDTRI